jgi:hypothetical protein
MEAENNSVPLGPCFGPLVVSQGHEDSQGRYVEDALWTASQGNLPPGSRPRLRRPRPIPGEVTSDELRR